MLPSTSLVNLISRLYDVTDGEILVGGRNVKEYDMEAPRKFFKERSCDTEPLSLAAGYIASALFDVGFIPVWKLPDEFIRTRLAACFPAHFLQAGE